MEKYWYAVQRGEDYDWGDGSHDYNEALKMAQKLKSFYPDDEIRIVTIEEGPDPIAIDEEVVD